MKEVTERLGVEAYNLNSWMKRNHPEVLEECAVGMTLLPGGKMALRRTYARFAPVAEYSKHSVNPV
jgi:hypothetical protein